MAVLNSVIPLPCLLGKNKFKVSLSELPSCYRIKVYRFFWNPKANPEKDFSTKWKVNVSGGFDENNIDASGLISVNKGDITKIHFSHLDTYYPSNDFSPQWAPPKEKDTQFAMGVSVNGELAQNPGFINIDNSQVQIGIIKTKRYTFYGELYTYEDIVEGTIESDKLIQKMLIPFGIYVAGTSPGARIEMFVDGNLVFEHTITQEEITGPYLDYYRWDVFENFYQIKMKIYPAEDLWTDIYGYIDYMYYKYDFSQGDNTFTYSDSWNVYTSPETEWLGSPQFAIDEIFTQEDGELAISGEIFNHIEILDKEPPKKILITEKQGNTSDFEVIVEDGLLPLGKIPWRISLSPDEVSKPLIISYHDNTPFFESDFGFVRMGYLYRVEVEECSG